MVDIVQKAYKIANEGDCVILSPGSSSFDMFKNFKDRGDQFNEAVKNL
jgi:UDP-N-acetylmuramoylalanine--D-glutamate ligase